MIRVETDPSSLIANRTKPCCCIRHTLTWRAPECFSTFSRLPGECGRASTRVGGQPRGQPHAGQREGYAVRSANSGRRRAGRRSDPARSIRWPQTARDALPLFWPSGQHLTELHASCFNGRRAPRVGSPALAANEDRAEKLGNVVVQFEGHAPRSASCACTRRWDNARSNCSLRRGSVMSVTPCRSSRARTVLCQRTNGDLRRNVRTVAALSSTWILEPDLGPCQEPLERCPVIGGEKSRKELPIAFSSGI